jgi:hypothetical protein
MPELKLLRIEGGDSQKNLIDKSNLNFSELVSFDGGPYGKPGNKGPRGIKGKKGPTGSYGDPGLRGTNWTIGPCQPGITGSVSGDLWMNTSNFNSVYKFYPDKNWIAQGFNLSGFDLFTVNGPLSTLSGISNKYGYFLSTNTPINYTFLISDNPSIISGTESSPNPLPNPQYSKFIISTNSLDPEKKILEFTKANYTNDSNFNSKTPRFYWDQGLPLNVGKYGLKFENKERSNFFVSGNIELKSNTKDFYYKGGKFNVFLNSNSSLFTVNATNDIYIKLNSGTARFSTKNISYGNNGIFTFGLQLNSASVSNGSQSLDSALRIISTNSQTGNLRYLFNSIPNVNSQLFYVGQQGGTLLGVYGNGYFYFDKKVSSIQNAQSITQTVTGSFGASTVNWTTIVPSVAVNSASGNYYYSNNGLDYIIQKSNSANPGERGICLWSPATGGTAGFNKGWLNLTENGEAISFRVHGSSSTPGQEDFRYIGLNTSDDMSASPVSTSSSNYSVVDLGTRASTVDFTIVNITGTGSTGGNRRWFRVYYSAWGGSMVEPACGILQTYNSTV